MERPHQRALRKCFTYLVENVRARDVIDYLFQEGALTLDDMEVIEQKGGDRMKTRELIKMLIQKRESHFRIFVEALHESATYHASWKLAGEYDKSKKVSQ